MTSQLRKWEKEEIDNAPSFGLCCEHCGGNMGSFWIKEPHESDYKGIWRFYCMVCTDLLYQEKAKK